MKDESSNISRRDFLVNTAISGAGVVIADRAVNSYLMAATSKAATQTIIGVPFEPRERVRLGIIGVGGRGTSLLNDLLSVDGVDVKAICDLVPEKVEHAQKMVTDAGQPKPTGFSKGDWDFKNLNQLDLDIVYVATPWNWHVPMAVDTMKNGKHVAVEVPAATSLQECWDLVNTSEATRKHCMILENCCYGSSEMMVLQMVRDGAFGEITHGEAAYLHDLRSIVTANSEKYICGDMNTSVIKTMKGRTILLQHDVVNPRPYSRLNMIQGTKGIFADYPPRVFMDGQNDEEWQKIDSFLEKYEHPLWKQNGEMARKTGGHGGMDYIMNFRLMDCLKRGLPPDIDVYDAAAWSAPTPLSEASVKANGAPQKFPDFTHDQWNGRAGVEKFGG